MNCARVLIAILVLLPCGLLAQKPGEGTVKGSVVDKANNRPFVYVTVGLRKRTDGQILGKAVTDARGAFTLEHVPFGDYEAVYSGLGSENHETPYFTLDARHPSIDLGPLSIADSPIVMEKVEVSTRQQVFLNTIDRKIYNVGKDIQSATGTASDLLQNIPSVQVDIDGNVSLRGDDNVLILVDGRSTPMMGANRAEVLQQMPADSIERIEVITNPSAKYKPDGTAGIINLVLKHKRDPGRSAVLRVVVGNDSRYGISLNANYNFGKYNLFGSFGVRQDDRPRILTDQRSHIDPATNLPITTQIGTHERSRPFSRIGQAGINYFLTNQDKLGETVNTNYRTFFRTALENYATSDSAGALTSDYNRQRTDPEYEKDVESKTTYEHDFADEGQSLSLEFRAFAHREQEDDHYANAYLVPAAATTYDHTRIKADEPGTEAIAEYAWPITSDSRFDMGYDRSEDKSDQDHFGESQDPVTDLWITDANVTNRFILDQTVDALYGTYSRTIGKFGVLAGLRMEEAVVDTDQATAGIVGDTRYARLYPSLHLTYDLTETRQLQLNYSHRVHRPEGDDLNPYPEFQDPFNLRAGNPRLQPEETHSVETGYQYRKDDTTCLATLYYRYSYNGFTNVSQYINSTTTLTTKENLAKTQSGGLELAANFDIGKRLSVNASANAYYNEIDASNLGYGSSKASLAWAGKLGAGYAVSKATLLQFNANYTAKQLTPQGYRFPTFVANLGLRHDLKARNVAFILTVSDLFNSLKEENRIDTAILHDVTTRRRSSRIVYAGFIYSFGAAKKKAKDDSLQFDNQL